MDCLEVRERIARGDDLRGLEGHLADCAPCQLLAEDDGALGQALGAPAAAPPLDFAALEASLAAETSLRGRLRSLPTWAQRLACLALAAGVAALLWVAKFQAPAASLDRALKAANVISLGLLCGLTIWNALRPLHQPPLAKRAVWTLAALALVVPFGLALMPYTDPGVPTPASKCFTFGSIIGLPVLVLALAMQRAPWTVAAATPLLLVALGAGMLGNVTLAGACHDHDATHLVLGHASVVLAFFGVAVAASQLWAGGDPEGEDKP